MKLIVHFVVFALGAGLGVYWGVHHPDEASQVSDFEGREAVKIKAEVAKAKIDLLQKVMADNAAHAAPAPSPAAQPPTTDYQKMMQSAQNDLNDANSHLNNQ
jgi:hypothetical protein